MIHRLQQHRTIVFGCAAVGTALFFLIQDGFFTLDGWAHGANARLLTAVVLGEPALDGLVRLNPSLVPNWSGHVLLALLQTIVPGLWAEKVLLALLVLTQAFGCARYVQALTGQRANVLLLLCLPAMLGQVLVFGFYNFMFATGVALWLAALWLDWIPDRWYRWPMLSSATLVVYVCHGSCVPFFLLLVLIGVFSRSDPPHLMPRMWRAAGIVLSFVPALLMLLAFDHGRAGTSVHADAGAAWDRLWRFTWIAPYDGYRERVHVLLFIAALISGLIAVLRRGPTECPARTWPVLAGAGGLVAGYFLLPDDTGYASYISLRVLTLAFLLLVIWLAARHVSRPLFAAAAAAMTLVSLGLALRFMAVEGAQARTDRDVVLRAAQRFKAGAVVLPVWRDARWLHQHRADLLGLERPVLLLENSQCNKGYCPLVWGDQLPDAFNKVAHYADPEHAALRQYMRSGTSPAVDHIVFMGPDLVLSEGAPHRLHAFADSLGYRVSFHEKDVLVLSRP